MHPVVRATATAVAGFAGVALVLAGCGGSGTQAPPAPAPGPPAAPTVTSAQVTGMPASLAPGETAQLTARATLSDGTRRT